MTVSATYSKLCALNATITGIVLAPTALPTLLNDTDVPCAIVRPGPATSNEHAVGLYRSEREYFIEVYVSKVGLGEGIDEGFQAVLPILGAAVDLYIRNPTLDETVDHIGDADGTFLRDSGVTTMKFAGEDYHGFTLTVSVIEKTT